ncbi:MAG: carbohydrate ABC transporter substrate-binding protein [Deltaproteobacteria bacterium]|nr:carbohydrate ABC transporter substrate-binding protein [Deltaproteobacteria bacterium]
MKLKLILCVLLILFLIGCTDNDEPTVQKRDDFKGTTRQIEKRLNWIGHWLGDHDREALVWEVATNFELRNPDVEINLKFPQQIIGVRSKPEQAKFIAELIRTGNTGWDIIWLDDFSYQYTSKELGDPKWGEKYLVNFEEVAGFKETQKSFIINDPVYREQTGGTIVGPYIEGYYYALYYNQSIAKEIGIEIKQYGMFFGDLLRYVKAVQKYNKKHGTDIAVFYEAKDWTTVEILFQNLYKSELKDFKKVKEKIGSKQKNTALLKTFKAFEELGKYNPLMSSYKENVWYQTRHFMLKDKCLFFVNGVWMYNHWMSMDEEKIKKITPAELPVFQKVDYYLGGFIPTWAVMKDAPNREEAIKLLMFWSRPQVAEKWVRYTKAPTGLVGDISVAGSGDTQFDKFQAKITEKYNGNIHYSADAGYILGEKNQLLQQDINKKLLQLLDGNITAQQAYDEIMKEVK